jgi:hypothetical protein
MKINNIQFNFIHIFLEQWRNNCRTLIYNPLLRWISNKTNSEKVHWKSLCSIIKCHLILHFLLTATMALLIKHTHFLLVLTEETFILQFFIQDINKCSQFLFTANALTSHFIFLPQIYSKYKIFVCNMKTRRHNLTNICLQMCWLTDSVLI